MIVFHLLQGASDLLSIADEADLARTRDVECFAEIAIEVVIAAEVHVLQTA